MLLEEQLGLQGRFGVTRFLDQGSDGSCKIFCTSEGGGRDAVAIKVIDLEVRFEEAFEEVYKLRSLQSPYIIPILSTFVHDHFALVVVPLYPYRSVNKLLRSDYEDGLPELAVSQILKDTLKGVEYLHRCNIVHRSLRSSHLLINPQGRIIISGLRHSIRVERSKPCHTFPTDHAMYNLCLLAPEILAQNLQGYHLKSDVYSLGILALELANGKAPFEGCDALRVLYCKLNDVVPSLNSSKCFRESFFDFTNKCLEFEPHLRPSSHQLLRHPFIKQNKKCNSLWKHIQPTESVLKENFEDSSNATMANGSRNCDSGPGENGNEEDGARNKASDYPTWSFEVDN